MFYSRYVAVAGAKAGAGTAKWKVSEPKPPKRGSGSATLQARLNICDLERETVIMKKN